MRHCLYGSSNPGNRSFGRFLRPLLEVYFTDSFLRNLKVKSLAVAEIFRYCKGFRLSYSYFCILDQKYKRGVYKSIFATPRLDCEWVSLNDLCEVITKGTTPHSFLSEGTIKYIKIESIVNGNIVNDSCQFIDQKTHEGALSRSILHDGDILFSIAGSLGICVIVKQSNLPANTNQALAIIRLKNNVNRNYILSVLHSSLMEEYILSSRTTGAQPNLSLQQMRDFKLPYPNECEQHKIASFAYMIERRISLENDQLAKLCAIKSALLQQLFI